MPKGLVAFNCLFVSSLYAGCSFRFTVSRANPLCAKKNSYYPFRSQRSFKKRQIVSSKSNFVDSQVSNMATEHEKLDFGVIVYSSSEYVEDFLGERLEGHFTRVEFIPKRLDEHSVQFAKGFDAVCLFVNDVCNEEVINELASYGVKLVAMRCAGFDRIDLKAAAAHGIRIVRVPSYSPRSVAEAGLALMLMIARNLRSAVLKVAVGNYTVNGLVGMELTGKTFGIVGTGKIGIEMIKLLRGFEGKILAYDVYQSDEAKSLGATYTDLETLLKESDIVSLHTPLLPSTRNIINKERLQMMKQNALLVNVSRGGLIDTKALIETLQYGDDGLQTTGGKLRAVAMDVYEGEDSLFFEDFTRLSASDRMKVWDNQFITLKSLPQVVITPHIAFLTDEALGNIGDTTLSNLVAAATGEDLLNEIKAQ